MANFIRLEAGYITIFTKRFFFRKHVFLSLVTYIQSKYYFWKLELKIENFAVPWNYFLQCGGGVVRQMPNENVEKVCLSEMSKLCQQLETKCHILKTFVVDFYFLVHRKVCCFMWELQKSVKSYIITYNVIYFGS